MKGRIDDFLVSGTATIQECLRQLCVNGRHVVFVVDDNKLKGTLSDGDIRRFLLSGGDLRSSVESAANFNPKFLFSMERERASAFLAENHISAVPIVNEDMCVVDVAFVYDIVNVDDVTIRELRGGDIPMVMEFFDQMAGDTRAMFNRGDVNRVRAIEHLNRKEEDWQIHFAATVSLGDGLEKMVGYVFLWNLDTMIPWLGIAVREDWKGSHLGRRLLKHVDEWAGRNTCGGVMLTSVPANIRAHALYSRMGYEYSGIYPNGEFLYVKRYGRNENDE